MSNGEKIYDNPLHRQLSIPNRQYMLAWRWGRFLAKTFRLRTDSQIEYDKVRAAVTHAEDLKARRRD